jgi:nucleotide-binding universal stress UspA family protein
MFRSVVVPLDGSPFAEQALPLAHSIARGAGASVHFVQVHGLYALKEPASSWGPYDPAMDALLKQEELAYLDSVARRLAEVHPLPTTSTVMSGMPADGILAHAKDSSADLIVMTSHGRGPVSRAFLGSVADELIRRVSVPVLVVRPGEATAGHLGQPVVRDILVAVDLSSLSDQILQPALALARSTGATVTLLHVIEPTWHHTSGATPVQAEEYIEALAKRLKDQGLNVKTRLIRDDHAATTILRESINGYDLIALTTRGRGGLKRLLLGSVADKVVRGTSVPVLVYCPRAD